MTPKKSKNISKVLTKKQKKNPQEDDPKIFFAKYTCHNINNSICFQNFPMNWNKQTSYLHKKSQSFLRKIINLPVFFGMFLRFMKGAFMKVTYFEQIFSRYQWGFSKGYNAQHYLLAMIEKWRKIVDDGDIFRALLTDLSKAFDCNLHNLIIAKLKAYSFHINTLKLIHNYLSHRKQRINITFFK